MSKKDFQAVAAAFFTHKAIWGEPAGEAWRRCVLAIADVLAASNPRFDRARFIEACETGRCKGMRQV